MGGAWRTMVLGLAVAVVALAWLGSAAAAGAGDAQALYGAALGTGAGVAGLWLVFARLSRHFRDLNRLAAELAAGGDPARAAGGRQDETGRLAAALEDRLRRDRPAGPGGEARLAAVAAALEEPVLVLADGGRITVANPPAQRLLGLAAQPGEDVYALFERPELFRAIERARGRGAAVPAVLPRIDGTALPARVADLGLQAGAAIVLAAHPSDARALTAGPAGGGGPGGGRHGRHPPPDDGNALAAVPLVALWVATTGAADGVAGDGAPAEGRVVAVGTVRLSGARVFRTLSLDLLIDAGEPIPPAATARHGVSDAMLAGERSFPDVWPVIEEALAGCAAVGLGIGVMLAALKREVDRAGLSWEAPPPALDLGRLAAALDPALAELGPQALAAALGVSLPAAGFVPHALLAAETAAVLVTRLEARGPLTLGEARALAPP